MEGYGNGRLLFARQFVKHPAMLGSAIPSSRVLIDTLLMRVDWRRTRVIVEYGPGVGTFTSAVLRRLPANARLLAIETNSDFVDYLRAELPDPRLVVEHGSAADVTRILRRYRLAAADYIISGIPFSVMQQSLRRNILTSTREALQPDGSFLVYQFSSKVRDDLHAAFERVEHGYVLRNMLPAHWFDCRKSVHAPANDLG